MTTGSVLVRDYCVLLLSPVTNFISPNGWIQKLRIIIFPKFVHHRVQTKPRPPKLLNYKGGQLILTNQWLERRAFELTFWLAKMASPDLWLVHSDLFVLIIIGIESHQFYPSVENDAGVVFNIILWAQGWIRPLWRDWSDCSVGTGPVKTNLDFARNWW